MVPPEVVLDRWIKSRASRRREFGSYVGKLDLEKVEPRSLRSFLSFLQQTMNTALSLENANASGGIAHPPFHFDYVEVSDDTKNAHAFQHDGFSFIAVTQPLIVLLWDLAGKLSNSQLVLRLLVGGDPPVRGEAVHALLFQLQLAFLVSHEYTHHVHRHCGDDGAGSARVWTEFSKNELSGDMNSQARELNADAYAIYLVLANYVRGAEQMGRSNLPVVEGNELLLMCFLLAVITFFCAMWPGTITTESIRMLTHPPAPVRIEYAIRVAKMWCSQYRVVPEAWFDADRFRTLFVEAAEAIGGPARQRWDSHISWLRSEDGESYNRELFERFEAMRKNRVQPTKLAPTA